MQNGAPQQQGFRVNIEISPHPKDPQQVIFSITVAMCQYRIEMPYDALPEIVRVAQEMFAKKPRVVVPRLV